MRSQNKLLQGAVDPTGASRDERFEVRTLGIQVNKLRQNTVVFFFVAMLLGMMFAVGGILWQSARLFCWCVAAIELCLGPVMFLSRLKYLAFVQEVQRYIVSVSSRAETEKMPLRSDDALPPNSQ